MRHIVTSVALFAGLALAAAANAQVAWGGGMANGSSTFFDWANGHNSNSNLFGTPTLIGNAFYFFPSNFVAASVNGVQAQATDTLEFDIIAHPNFKIDGLSISEVGDYSINGIGQVDLTGTLQISDANHPAMAPNSLGYNPVFPASSGVNQNWSGQAMTDLTAFENGVPFTVIHVSVTNDLVAISVPGSSAVIRKTVVGDAMAIQVLPEPGVLGLLAMAGLAAARRRRA